jgi:hypothetical protein
MASRKRCDQRKEERLTRRGLTSIGKTSSPCWVRVISAPLTARQSLPVFPNEQTSAAPVGMSQSTGAVIPEPVRSSRSFQDAQRSAGEPGIHPSAVRPLRGPRGPKTAPPFVRDGRVRRRRRNGHRSFIDLAPPTVGQVRATVGPACGPSTRRREPLSRASPSGTRSRSGGAPLPRPARWRAA